MNKFVLKIKERVLFAMINLKLFLKSIFAWNKVDIDENNKIEWYGKIKNARFRVKGGKNEIYFGRNSVIKNSKISIRGKNNRIIFDDNCAVRRMIVKFEGNNSVLRIGKNTTIEGIKIWMGEGKIEIGDNCILAYEIEMRNTDNHSIFFNGIKINPNKDIRIEDFVWIGARVMILKGSKVGKGSIVGAGSIVSGKFGENIILAGNPAKKIKENIKWEK